MQQKLNYNLIITLASILISWGTTLGYLKATMGNMEKQIATLTAKVEQHNNFGIRIATLEREAEIYKRIIDNKLK
jgi:hypothetical protein